jgi:hypothetical protein
MALKDEFQTIIKHHFPRFNGSIITIYTKTLFKFALINPLSSTDQILMVEMDGANYSRVISIVGGGSDRS